MFYLSVLLLAVAATTDSFIIGFNYGVKTVRISRTSNLLIAVFCFLGTLISMQLGRLAACWLTPQLCDLPGGIVLTLLGGYMLYGALDTRKSKKEHVSEHPEAVDQDGSRVIEWRESFMLGLLLSLNNIGLGIGAGISGFPLWLTAPACAVCSYLFIEAGCFLGRRFCGKRLSHILETACSALILTLGISNVLRYFW